jgi:hypothetical protein
MVVAFPDGSFANAVPSRNAAASPAAPVTASASRRVVLSESSEAMLSSPVQKADRPSAMALWWEKSGFASLGLRDRSQVAITLLRCGEKRRKISKSKLGRMPQRHHSFGKDACVTWTR